MRVVSLTCSNTEIVCALGCQDWLVGVDDHSDYPKEIVNSLPRVGPDLGIDIQKVANLKPDLVLASLTVPGHEKIVEGLQKAKLPYLAPEPRSLEDVYDDIRTIGRALSVSQKAESVIEEMRGKIEVRPGRVTKAKLLVEWWPKPVIVPGKQSWLNRMMEYAGAENPWAGDDVKSRPIHDEEAVKADPDAIVIAWCGVPFHRYRKDVVLNREGWRNIKAIRAQHVYCVSEAFLGRPSPRLVDGVKAFRDIVNELAEAEINRE